METPYQSPSTDPEFSKDLNKVPTFKKLALTGTIFLSAHVFGSLLSVYSMTRALGALGNGDTDPAILAGYINDSLIYRAIGAFIGLIGIILVSIALFSNTNREKWFLHSVTTLSVLISIFLFPLGLIVGLYLFIVFWSKRREFTPKALPIN